MVQCTLCSVLNHVSRCWFLLNRLSYGLGQYQIFPVASATILILSFMLLLIITFRRRGWLKQSKLTNWTTWSFFVLSSLPYWFIFNLNLYYRYSFDSAFSPNQSPKIDKEINHMRISYILLLLSGQLDAAIPIFIDSNLRKTYFKKYFIISRSCLFDNLRCVFNKKEAIAPPLQQTSTRL